MNRFRWLPNRVFKPEEPPESRPAMIGLPPSARGLRPIPDDPGDHAKDFANRYWDLLEAIARKRMKELGVPEDRIGMLDADNDYRVAAFHTDQLDGGGVHPQLDGSTWTPGCSSRVCLPRPCRRMYH